MTARRVLQVPRAADRLWVPIELSPRSAALSVKPGRSNEASVIVRGTGRASSLVVMAALWNTAGHYIFVLWFLLMAALRSRCGHYIFALWFLSSSSSSFYGRAMALAHILVLSYCFFFFFPRLISAVADWMSAILPHMVWP